MEIPNPIGCRRDGDDLALLSGRAGREAVWGGELGVQLLVKS